MSVREPERDESKIEFIKVLMDIEKWCLRKSETAPKKYRFMINNQLIKHSADAYSYAKMANSIRVKDSDTKQMRENYFTRAYISIQAFSSQIDIIYEICRNDFMTNKEHEQIAKDTFNGLRLLKGIVKSDKERYKDL